MRYCMEKHHLNQAKIWLRAAIKTSDDQSEGDDKYAVAVAMTIHAVLKANDALTYKFLQETAKKHDVARLLFDKLIKMNQVDAKYANYSHIIQDAINNKAKAEYRGAYFSKNDFDDLYRKAEKFLKMAEEITS